MNTRTTVIALAIIALAALAYYFYATKPAAESADGAGQAAGIQKTANDPSMHATWRSTEDPKFTRTFRADGTVTDAYEGDAAATESGTYAAIDPATETGFPLPAANFSGTTVIRIDFERSGPMYFGILTLTESELAMTNISGRGNTLSFVRVQ